MGEIRDCTNALEILELQMIFQTSKWLTLSLAVELMVILHFVDVIQKIGFLEYS